jgi:precorrin-6B methylase 1
MSIREEVLNASEQLSKDTYAAAQRRRQYDSAQVADGVDTETGQSAEKEAETREAAVLEGISSLAMKLAKLNTAIRKASNAKATIERTQDEMNLSENANSLQQADNEAQTQINALAQARNEGLQMIARAANTLASSGDSVSEAGPQDKLSDAIPGVASANEDQGGMIEDMFQAGRESKG